MAQVLNPGQSEEIFEGLIQGLLDRGFGCCSNFLDESVILGLRTQLLHHLSAGTMKPAGVGRSFDYQKNAEVRGDVIQWIDERSDVLAEQQFVARVNGFVNYLNTTCFTNITSFEFHYAYYAPGSFYKRHLDQFKTNKGRKFSLVLYLNEDWKPSDGGHLSLYLKHNERVDEIPTAGKVVFFRSDEIKHEVWPSHNRFRLSIAGRLKG
jgi:SM-20-related protein